MAQSGGGVGEGGSDKHKRTDEDGNFRCRPVIQIKTKAIVREIRRESPTVRGITLQVDDPQFSFKAGQWVDMFIPGIDTITGFSMYSSPKQLVKDRTLELGIQFSEWPPTFWVHDKCQVNSSVDVRVGGDTYYDPQPSDDSQDLLLIAGGVGINPLASMFFHVSDLHQSYREEKENEGYRPGKTLLLFSAKTREELLYKPMLDSVVASNSSMEVKYFTTREQSTSPSEIHHSRITAEVLGSSLGNLNTPSLKVFVCGPAPMIDDIEQNLLKCGLSQNQIMYEKWW